MEENCRYSELPFSKQVCVWSTPSIGSEVITTLLIWQTCSAARLLSWNLPGIAILKIYEKKIQYLYWLKFLPKSAVQKLKWMHSSSENAWNVHNSKYSKYILCHQQAKNDIQLQSGSLSVCVCAHACFAGSMFASLELLVSFWTLVRYYACTHIFY